MSWLSSYLPNFNITSSLNFQKVQADDDNKSFNSGNDGKTVNIEDDIASNYNTASDSHSVSTSDDFNPATPNYNRSPSPVSFIDEPTQSLTLPSTSSSGKKKLFSKLFNKRSQSRCSTPSRRLSVDSIPSIVRTHTHRQPFKSFKCLYLNQVLPPHNSNLSALPLNLAEKVKKSNQNSSRPQSPTNNESHSRSASYDEDDAIYDIRFNFDGTLLASANFNGLIRVHHLNKDTNEFDEFKLNEFKDHASGVGQLDWSRNNFLLSSSLDKTVKLWHPNRSKCLQSFKHPDIVTHAKFHPIDDRYFISSSLDATIRLWSINKNSTIFTTRVSELITACNFSASGKYILIGSLNGQLDIFKYHHKGLQHVQTIKLYNYSNQTHIHGAENHSSRRVNSSKKIIGINNLPNNKNDEKEEELVIVTNADNRSYLISLKEMKVLTRFKGHRNRVAQVSATPSSDGNWLSSGSEDKNLYVWPINKSFKSKHNHHDSILIPGYELWQTPEIVKSTAILRQDNDNVMIVGGSDSGRIYVSCHSFYNNNQITYSKYKLIQVYKASVVNEEKVPEFSLPKPNQLCVPPPPTIASIKSTDNTHKNNNNNNNGKRNDKKIRHKRPLSALPILGGSSPFTLSPTSSISPKNNRHQYF